MSGRLRLPRARVFAAALGIRQSDWRYLHDQLLRAVVDAEVRGPRITLHGVLYDVIVLIDGLNGATHRVPRFALVEISDDRGHTLDFLSLSHEALASAGDGVSRAAS